MDEGEDHGFHRNEAISAVADDGFLGEEDDDFDDLYNDVNVGENFLQSMKKKEEDLGFRNEVVEEKKEVVQPGSASAGVSIPNVGNRDGGGGGGDGRDSRVLGYENQNSLGNEVRVPGGSGVVGASGGGIRVELVREVSKVNPVEERRVVNNSVVESQGHGQQSHGGSAGNVGGIGAGIGGGNESLPRPSGMSSMNAVSGNSVITVGGSGSVTAGVGGGSGGGGGTMLFVGELHWWTTDAELEGELCKYGVVKEVKFFDEKASGKSKGYCQVEFYDAAAAAACKEGMNGHLFNGRPCVVAFASPYSIKRMGEAQVSRNQQMGQAQGNQVRRAPSDAGSKNGGNNNVTGGNFQADNNRGYGRGNWGRGNSQGMGNRGPVGPMRNRGAGMGGRGMMGNGGNGFGPGMGGAGPMMHPQSMMGQGFDPAFGGPMGRMGGYGGFPAGPTPPFSGLMSSFPPVGGVGLPGVAPHVNPAVFGRGMPMNGMGMMPTGADGPNMGMWPDPNMGGWGGDDHGGGRAGESSYGEEAASDHQYGEVSHDRGGSSDRRYRDDREPAYDRDIPGEKDMGHNREWSERRHRDDRDSVRERERDYDREKERSRDRERDRERERDRYKEERDRHDHYRYRDHESERDDYDRGRSSRAHSKSRISHGEEHRSRSRDADYGKRRRLSSE